MKYKQLIPDDLMEKLADIEHQRWAKWQKYLHSRCVKDNVGEGYLCIPMGLVKHWEEQIDTEYKDLSESEKESDRNQVRMYERHIFEFVNNECGKRIRIAKNNLIQELKENM